MKNVLAAALALLLGTTLPAQADQAKLEAAINGDQRTPAWNARDQYRHPLETLELFDVQAHHTVVEIWPGGGWYTEILAPYLRDDGLLIAAHYASTDTQSSYRAKSRASFEEKLAANKKIYGKVKVSSLMLNEKEGTLAIPSAPANSVDRVLTFRSAHNWASRGTTDAAFAHFYDVLKAGGKLGIVQHMADPDQDWMSKNIGYVGRDFIISSAAKAGFTLEAEGYFNRNPLDSKRHSLGVWQLPPGLQDLKTDAEKAPYLAIGESNRMTLVFVKP